MHGPSKQPNLTPEQMREMIPQDLKEIRELSLALMSTDIGKRWLEKMKDYYIMQNPVAMPEFPPAFVRFREGQNSLLRAIEIFSKEEAAFNQYVANQLIERGRTN